MIFLKLHVSFFLRLYFGHIIVCNRIVKESRREREWAGSGKVHEPGHELGTPESATALYVGTLPTRLLMLTIKSGS